MKRKATVLFLFSILFTFSVQAGQVFRSLNDIPLYPGAVADKEAMAEAMAEEERFLSEANMELRSDDQSPLIRRSTSIHIYKVAKPAEAVLQFYLEKLGGIEEDGAEHLYGSVIAAGAVSSVYHQIAFIDFSGYNRKDAGETRATLEKIRVPFEPGKWIAGADFAWAVGEKNADVSHFDVMVRDDYFYTFDEHGHQKIQTGITIKKTTYMNPRDAQVARREAIDERENDDEQETADTVRELTGTTFNPEEIGITVYPGAAYDEETTRFLRQTMACNGAAYQSNENARTIAEFYGRTGFKIIHSDDKEVLLKRCKEEYNEFLKKTISTGECDVEITLQNPWKNMNTGKLIQNTLISIVNRSE